MSEFDDVMTQIGFGRVHLFAMVTNGLLQMMTITETMGMAIVGPASVCDMRMNLVQLSTILSACFLGIISSSFFWGNIADKMGRRWTLLHTITLSNVCSLISMFTVNFHTFFMMRFATGIFVAGPSFVAVTYLSEFCNKHILARVVSYMYMFSGFGMLYSPSLASFILTQETNYFEIKLYANIVFKPWRLMGCLLMLPGFFAFILLLFMPESPRFLFMIGDTEKAMKVMNWVSKKNTGHPLTNEQIIAMSNYKDARVIKRRKSRQNFVQAMFNDAMPLFRKPYRALYICSCAVMFCLAFVSNGLGIWYTALRNRINLREGDTAHMTFCEIILNETLSEEFTVTEPRLNVACNNAFKGFNDSILLGISYIILYNICAAFLFCVPRKILFIFALIFASASGIIMVFVKGHYLQVFAFVFFIALPGVVVSLLGGALLEFVPTEFRAKAMCISLMWSRWGAVVAAHLVGVNFEINCNATIIIIAVIPLLSASIQGFLPL